MVGVNVSPEVSTHGITRRAWGTLLVSIIVLACVLLILLAAAGYVFDHASRPRTVHAMTVSGSGALWRSSPTAEWRLISESVELSEGEEISTDLGTVVWVTFFDGSTLEIAEHSQLQLERLRESRFSDEARQIVIRLDRGTIYGSLAPAHGFRHTEFQIRSEDGVVTMTDDHNDPNDGSFLIEQHPPDSLADNPFRAASFHGRLKINTGSSAVNLTGPAQLAVDRNGVVTESSAISAELIQNGNFARGLAGWDTFYTASGREPAASIGRVLLSPNDSPDGSTSVRFIRPESSISATTGIRQPIDRSLRLPASLTLELDIWIDHQSDNVETVPTTPLGIELSYEDILGQERVWRSVYRLDNLGDRIDADIATVMTASEWTHVIVDLHNIEPIPRILGTLVVYASGTGYQSEVANLSLTTGEGSVVP